MKLVVVGIAGQLAQSLAAAAKPDVTVVTIGRPAVDLARPETIAVAIAAAAPDVVVNAAAYTAVDKAESDSEAAFAVNATGAGAIAAAAEACGAPLIHISTDYVFDGSAARAYRETDAVSPLGVYGRSKLEGERLVQAAAPRHVILRTAWVHSPYGHNFVKTMLRVAATRPELSVVDDQIGNPTFAPHLAAGIIEVARQIAGRPDAAWGVYHAAGTGDVTWCGLAREIFAVSARHGGPTAHVKAITTAEYPTPARRPANSRLDCGKLAAAFGVRLPRWEAGVEACVTALASEDARPA